MKHDVAVMIGRFQPVHMAHLQVIRHALDVADRLIVVVGSFNASPTVRNPWTAQERIEMIHAAVEHDPRVTCIAARDYLYNNNTWLHSLQNSIAAEIRRILPTNPAPTIALIGCKKDATSFYLNFFPQWTLIEHELIPDMDATTIREDYFTPRPPVDYVGWSDHALERPNTRKKKGIIRLWSDVVPAPVKQWLEAYKHSPAYTRMVEEFAYITAYKDRWASSPFPPTFVTADAVVIRSGHILVVKRGRTPGKGLLALPGGFIGEESVLDAAIRELIEETGIDFTSNAIQVLSGLTPSQYLARCVIDSKVFDHPLRSSRGRTITHAFCFDLGSGSLPTVHGADDAESAMWLSLSDIGRHENQFFEDHVHIINHFASKF